MSEISKEKIEELVSNISIPGKAYTMRTLGLVKNVAYCEGIAKITIGLPPVSASEKVALEEKIKDFVLGLEGMKEVQIVTETKSGGPIPLPSASANPQAGPQKTPPKGVVDRQPIEGVRNIIAVASGKGGVGKSTVAANLALALLAKGKKVGICDADIYGPSMPLMLGIQRRPELGPDRRILPLERNGLKVMSIGFLLEEDTAVIWRGPMVMQMVRQFLRDVNWGELDYLILDLPPGTGDAQLTIVQTVPLTGAIIVTTPNDIALLDARRGLSMFREVQVPVLGIVENMSIFECPHCHTQTPIFDQGGGKRTAQELGVPFLAEIPIDTHIRSGGDAGNPVVLQDANSTHSKSFMQLADAILNKTAGKSFLGSLLSKL